jgi:hypothetical protein
MITIGRMAKEYGLLPHQVEQSATTYDFMIMDVLQTYDAYNQQKASGKIDPSMYRLDTKEMQTLMERAKSVK